MTKHALRLVLVLVTLLTASLLQAVQTENIAVSSTAAPDYIRKKNAAGGMEPETYIFTQGHFLGGDTVDKGLSKTTFSDILKILVPNLAKQNYLPTADVTGADLVIFVHWGLTQVYQDPEKAFANDELNNAVSEYNASIGATGKADSNNLNMALDRRETTEASTMGAIARNAALLGYARSLGKERHNLMPTAAEQTMNEELNEERYFIILMAYDNLFRKGLHKQRLLWVTRLSVRSPGNNFADSLPAMSKVGADLFGHQLDELVRVKTPIQRGSVKLGEMEILGTVQNPNPDKTDKPANPEKKDK